ncbi:hypothetical protein D0Z08_30100 [Nocardioides immobilis]|uniref:Uncharacterized protein n=1 Tax=Nocardioides immobilis TaxID=2049295 RepID=A0A417XSR0_9ACTN|nr:hypothetical protein D0Z08_30100 [Nocardioides immobilis]
MVRIGCLAEDAEKAPGRDEEVHHRPDEQGRRERHRQRTFNHDDQRRERHQRQRWCNRPLNVSGSE